MRYLQEIMPNILMRVTIYVPFDSNREIDGNWNWLHYHCVSIISLLFFLYVESLLCKPKFSVLSYSDCIHIVTPADLDCLKWRSAHDIA